MENVSVSSLCLMWISIDLAYFILSYNKHIKPVYPDMHIKIIFVEFVIFI